MLTRLQKIEDELANSNAEINNRINMIHDNIDAVHDRITLLELNLQTAMETLRAWVGQIDETSNSISD